MKKRWGIFLLLVAGLGLLLAWFITFSGSLPNRQSRLLANGNSIVLEKVDYGKEHRLWDDRHALARLTRFLPSGLQYRFNLPGSISFNTDEEVLVCWLTLRDPQGKYTTPGFGRLDVLDEHGCLFHTMNCGSWGGMNITACPLQLHSFPRHEKEFTLRVYDWQNTRLAEFKVRNPVVVKATPPLPPQPLPATRTIGDLTVTLERVNYSVNAGFLQLEPGFRIAQNGQSTGDWSVHENAWCDATGNRAEYGDGLCLKEGAWKLLSRLYRNVKAPFATNEFLRLPSRPAPLPGTATMLSGTKRFGAASLELWSFGSAGSYTFSNNVVTTTATLAPGRMGTSYSTSTTGTGTNRVELISVDMDGIFVGIRLKDAANNQRLFVRLLDQNGKIHEADYSGGCNDIRFYVARSLTNATSLTVDFIVQQAREVDYVIAPPQK